MTASTNSRQTSQSCPICSKLVTYSSRYPDYVCNDCMKLATDKHGTPVAFYNTFFSGHGCKGFYPTTQADYSSQLCYIKGYLCFAEATYMGGIIIRPLDA